MDIADHRPETHDKAAVINRFLAQIAPQEAEQMSDIIHRLLLAQEMGDGFIYLNNNERKIAENAPTLVGKSGVYPFILSKNRLFTAKVHQLEGNIAHRINRFGQLKNTEPSQAEHKLLAQLFTEGSDIAQKTAAQSALEHPFLVISGGPGTGKTTTVAKILALLCQTHYATQPARIALSAPTGKAAAHLQAALKRALSTFTLPEEVHQHLQSLKGTTLHRLLSLAPPMMQPRFHRHHPLPYDIVVIDEASMMDLSISAQLLDALAENSRLILLGDAHQLPSVGMGAVLASLLTASDQKAQPAHVQLTTSHRFDANSGIGNLAKAVNNANISHALHCFEQHSTELTLQTNQQHIYQEYYQSQQKYWQAVADKNIQAAFDHFYDSIMLCVLRQDAEQFNQGYLKYLHQQGHQGEFFDGFPLMITRNNPANDLYNGDIGLVFNKENSYQVYFPTSEALRSISVARLAEYTPAFSLTVHKSQGSEYRTVRLLSPTQENTLFDRTLLYTALTRAKEHFTYLGNQTTFQAAIERKNQRNSALAERIVQQK